MSENRVHAGVPTGGQWATSAKHESGVSLTADPVATAQDRRLGAVGSCPDCGSPLVGHIGNGKFVPGTQCRTCHHLVAETQVETEPDEDGRTFLYTFEEDATVRITDDDGDTVDLTPPYEQGWDAHLAAFGLDGQGEAVRDALASRAEPERLVAEACLDAGLGDAVGAFQFVLDRDRVPLGRLVAMDADEIESRYDTYIGRAVDSLERDYSGFSLNEDPLRKDGHAHVDLVCDEAGLGSMKHFYNLLADRDGISNAAASSMTADQVTDDFETHVAPAIDRLEDRMLSDHCYGEAEREAETLDNIVEYAETMHEEVDTSAMEDSLAAAWEAFDGADGTPEALRTYADAIEEVARYDVHTVASTAGYNTELAYDDMTTNADVRDNYFEKRIETMQGRLRTAASRLRRAADALD